MSIDAPLSSRSIAVTGASDIPVRIGGAPIALLKRAGFAASNTLVEGNCIAGFDGKAMAKPDKERAGE